MIEVKNVSIAVGAKKILDDVSVEIKAGEVVVLLGATGAGKSTLLKAMCGDVKLTGGEIYLENRRLSEWDYHELARKRAVLSQHSTLNFPFTAREVALLGRNPHIRGRESKKDLEIVREALQLVEAAHFANQSFPTLSGGEQQRVHLARVLAQIWERQNRAIFVVGRTRGKSRFGASAFDFADGAKICPRKYGGFVRSPRFEFSRGLR